MFNASNYQLLDAYGPPATVISTHYFTQHVFIVRFIHSGEEGTLSPCPTIPGSTYSHFIDSETEGQIDQVTCPRSCS